MVAIWYIIQNWESSKNKSIAAISFIKTQGLNLDFPGKLRCYAHPKGAILSCVLWYKL